MKQKLDDLFNEAKQALLEDRDPAAAELFQVYLKRQPRHASAWFFTALLCRTWACFVRQSHL